MKTIVVICILLFCVGCYQNINHAEIMKAEYFCKDKGGVATITEYFVGGTKFACLNGETTLETGVKLPSDYKYK